MPQLIFVTGASGFLGSQIVAELLDKGYRVRAASRGTRLTSLSKTYAHSGDRFEAVSIPDIATGQFPEALDGVHAVIHTAAPVPDRAEPHVILKGALEGTLNVVHQAHAAGIKYIVVTSTAATLMKPYTDKDWCIVDKEKVLNGSRFEVYRAAKTLAEQALWTFGETHPELDITTIVPPYIYGPFAEGFSQSTPDYYALSSNLNIYRLLAPSGQFPEPVYVDIRDVARAHVLALNSPPECSVGRKRIVLSSPHGVNFGEVVKLLEDKRPQLKDRLIKTTPPVWPFDRLPIDFGRIEEVLGLKKDDFQSLEATILGAVDSVLAIEKEWVAQGHEIEIPQE